MVQIAGFVANIVDPDETPRSAESHLGLHCFLRPVCPNTYDKYGKIVLLSLLLTSSDFVLGAHM